MNTTRKKPNRTATTQKDPGMAEPFLQSTTIRQMGTPRIRGSNHQSIFERNTISSPQRYGVKVPWAGESLPRRPYQE
jgi:hypothetical protein